MAEMQAADQFRRDLQIWAAHIVGHGMGQVSLQPNRQRNTFRWDRRLHRAIGDCESFEPLGQHSCVVRVVVLGAASRCVQRVVPQLRNHMR